LTRLQLAGRGALPATVPLILVLPFLWITDARLGLDVVEPGVLDTVTAGPHILAGDRAGVATDALVQVQDHGYLGADFHYVAPSTAVSLSSPSSQSTFFILRTITNSSRLLPTVP